MSPIKTALVFLLTAFLNAIFWKATNDPLFLMTGFISCIGAYWSAGDIKSGEDN